MTKGCESCAYNESIEDNGRYEDVCTHHDHPGIQPDSINLHGCDDWTALRIRRVDDETVYQPKSHSRRIRELYLIKEATGIPMTVLLDRAIAQLVESYKVKSDNEGLGK